MAAGERSTPFAAVINDFNPTFYPVVAATLVVLVTSTFVLRFGYRPPPRMGWIDAFYFTIETMTTTGYGDFSFVNQPTWLRMFSALLMFTGVTTTALLVSFVADVLLSRRFVLAGGTPTGAASAQPHRRRRAERARPSAWSKT